MANSRVHNVRFYNPKPYDITCMALNKEKQILALSRSDGSIELWNLQGKTCFIEKRIAPSVENPSIKALAWCKDKLYSVGLHGFLVDYNLLEIRADKVYTVTGGAANCLCVNRDQDRIAVGTEQGYINIFSVTEDDEVLYSKLSDKQEGSILCLKYNHSGDFIVTGSCDAIRIWNANTGHAVNKMKTGRAEGQSHKETSVWCLEVTRDLTIVSGDTRGRLTFWDGNIPAQIESFQSHKADVLSLCLSDDENTLFCSGVDPTITQYVKVDIKGNKKWVRSVQRRVSEQAVKAMVLCGTKLYSGGVDGYLDCTFHPPKTIIRHPPMSLSSCVGVAGGARLLLLQYSKHLEIWSLGNSENGKTLGLLQLTSEPEKLVVLERSVRTDGGINESEGVICSAISHDGRYIAYGTSLGVRVFKLDHEDHSSPTLSKIDNFTCDIPVSQVAISSDNYVFVALPKVIQIHKLINEAADEKQEIKINPATDFTDTITHLKVSSCGKFLIAADPRSNIVIWSRKNKKWSRHCKLPRYKFGPTALEMNSNTLNLCVSYADNMFIEYDVRKKEFTKFSRGLSGDFPAVLSSRSIPIKSITFDPRNDDLILLHDDSTVIAIDKKKEPPSPDTKKAKLESSRSTDQCPQTYDHVFRSISKYKHLVYLGWVANDELVAVEIPPLSIKKQLPPSFFKHAFGKK